MTFALFLQIPNHIKFNQTYALWAETLPQFLFLWSIFGYLIFCIIYKWSVDWAQANMQPPSLLNTLIQMFLTPGFIKDGEQLYSGQGTVQMGLLILAGICVPWMLCTKPYILWKEMKRTKEQGYGQIRNDDELENEEEGNGAVQEMHEDREGDGGDDDEVRLMIYGLEGGSDAIS
jgi:V-type H+-transporting ATPase subunit a